MDTCQQHDCHPNKGLLITFGVIYTVLFLLAGVLGFVPKVAPDGLLFGFFRVDALHSIIHLVTGLIALWCVACSAHATQLFFRWIGVIYALLAVVGFWYGDRPLFDIIPHNMADAWLHLVLGVIALIIGFCSHCAKCPPKGDECHKQCK